MSNRNVKIQKLKEKFADTEIFCPHILKKFGSGAWEYLSNEYVDNLYYFRFILFNRPIFINYPSQGRVERGIRCNLCKITKKYTKRNEAYMTAHFLNGSDMDVKGLTAEEVRTIIRETAHSLPHPILIEKDVSWVHWDTRNYTGNMIHEF